MSVVSTQRVEPHFSPLRTVPLSGPVAAPSSTSSFTKTNPNPFSGVTKTAPLQRPAVAVRPSEKPAAAFPPAFGKALISFGDQQVTIDSASAARGYPSVIRYSSGPSADRRLALRNLGLPKDARGEYIPTKLIQNILVSKDFSRVVFQIAGHGIVLDNLANPGKSPRVPLQMPKGWSHVEQSWLSDDGRQLVSMVNFATAQAIAQQLFMWNLDRPNGAYTALEWPASYLKRVRYSDCLVTFGNNGGVVLHATQSGDAEITDYTWYMGKVSRDVPRRREYSFVWPTTCSQSVAALAGTRQKSSRPAE